MVALKPAFNHLAAKVHFPATRTANSGLGSAFFRPQNGARYLNPQTGLWLSTDPAMGEYVPAAPINDEVRKQNQNLPGMGGIFNTVNLHVYHYAGNNPVKYTDPDGRESGYVRNKDAVAFQGHAGVFAKRADGVYIYTEVGKLRDIDTSQTFRILTPEKLRNDGAFPISVFNDDEIAVIQYEFDEIGKMKDFFAANGFDDYIEFATTTEQDAAIINLATQIGREEFTDYLVPGNHCGIFAEKALGAGGLQTLAGKRNLLTALAVLTGNLPLARELQAPNSIGDQLYLFNIEKAKVIHVEQTKVVPIE
jgi:hypothetical protein